MRIKVLDLNFFHSLYISKKYIFHEHVWVCCGFHVMVIYDVIDRHIKTIRRISANNIELYLADITEMKFQISKLMIVTVGLVVIVCRMILLYEGRFANILLGNQWLVVWTAVLDLGMAHRACSRAPAHWRPSGNKSRMLIISSATQHML